MREGFAPLPRRLDEERPERPRPRWSRWPTCAASRWRRASFTPAAAGCSCSCPIWCASGCEAGAAARLPGSMMIPAEHALRAGLALKLWSIERKSHVMALVADPGLALFCWPERDPEEELPLGVLLAPHPREDHAPVGRLAPRGRYEEALCRRIPSTSTSTRCPTTERTRRSNAITCRCAAARQPSILAFLAQDADGHAFCYSNADLRKGEEAEEIFRFIAFWKKHHGEPPRHLVFDSRLTTYAHLARLDAVGIPSSRCADARPVCSREIAACPFRLAPCAAGRPGAQVPDPARVRANGRT